MDEGAYLYIAPVEASVVEPNTPPIIAPITLGQQKAVPFTSPAVQVIDTTTISAPIDLVSTPLDATSNKALSSLIETTFNSKAPTEAMQSVAQQLLR